MTEGWYDERLMKNCILIVGVYFETEGYNVQNDARRLLENLAENKELKKYAKIEALEYALKRYISNPEKRAYQILEKIVQSAAEDVGNVEYNELEYLTSRYIVPIRKRIAGKTKGGEYKFLVKNATPEFYSKLKELLDKKKQNEPKWFGDYYILVAKRVEIPEGENYESSK